LKTGIEGSAKAGLKEEKAQLQPFTELRKRTVGGKKEAERGGEKRGRDEQVRWREVLTLKFKQWHDGRGSECRRLQPNEQFGGSQRK